MASDGAKSLSDRMQFPTDPNQRVDWAEDGQGILNCRLSRRLAFRLI